MVGLLVMKISTFRTTKSASQQHKDVNIYKFEEKKSSSPEKGIEREEYSDEEPSEEDEEHEPDVDEQGIEMKSEKGALPLDLKNDLVLP